MKKPKIRFNGFTEDWEQRKLEELAQVCDSARIPNDEWAKEGIPYIRASDLTNDDLTGVLFLAENIYKKYDAKTGSPSMGDVLFNGGGEIGKSVLKRDNNPLYVQGGAVLYVKTSESDMLSGEYLNVFFASPQAKKYIESASAGGTMKHFTLVPSNAMPIRYPSMSEQEKIGQIFDSLTKLITLHQRKCDETKKLKKFMLQKMFPQGDSRTPEIRFAGFTEAWEQRKFADLGAVAMCKRIFKEQTLTEGDVPFYKIGTFGGTADAYISRELFEKYKALYPYPEPGAILISASGSIGRTVEFSGKDEYFQDSNIIWFKHDDRLSDDFLKCLYGIIEWAGIEGSTIKRLYNDNFLKTEFMMPCIEEQKKIGQFFRYLDHLIALHQRKCDELKNMKKFMLQNMFV